MLNHKEDILNHFNQSIEYVESLRNLSEKGWWAPIKEGKWTVAEIIAHFKPWDEIIIEKRAPYFFSEKPMPKLEINMEAINKEASSFGVNHSKEETIERFKRHRKNLIDVIAEIEETRWNDEIVIGKNKLTIYDYFHGLAEHDEHHFKQIDTLLASM